MADFTDALTDKQIAIIQRQPMFFVATACADGRINLSPKGYDSFRILSPARVAYLDLGGSGNETHAHLMANGRITIMFCTFENPALIIRIYGHGKPVLPQDVAWADLAGRFDILPGTRQIFEIMVTSVQSSCGWGVPIMDYAKDRETLKKAHRQMDGDAWLAQVTAQDRSIDGLPTRPTAQYFSGETEA